jgi:Cell wall-active antibiotics response 4TMS YvqF
MRSIRAWIGIVLVTIGVLGVLDVAGVLESTGFVEGWWPLAIVGAGVVLMIEQRRIGLGPAIIAAVGAALLADQQGWTSEDLLGPMLLAVIGAAILFGAMRRASGEADQRPMAVFGGAKVQDRSAHFRHSDVTALFGGATLDLRDAHIDDEATVDATAIFGGVDVLVPKGWRVSVSGLPIFGGYEDKTQGNGSLPTEAPHLDVRATAIFGGIDVAHEPS